MRQIALLLEYGGTAYFGFQYQPGAPTVQGELERGLELLIGQKSRIKAAGRTDTGVHALGQVATFRTSSALPERTWVTGLNHHLPPDIAVKAAREVAEDFDVRGQARSREYLYCVLNEKTPSPLFADRAYWVKSPLDEESMTQCALQLVGRRDFRTLAGPLGRRSPVRNLYRAAVVRKGRLLFLCFEADSFLPHQVRRMVGALIDVGRGRLRREDFAILLAGAEASGPVAPACGLYLRKVNYAFDLFPSKVEDLCPEGV